MQHLSDIEQTCSHQGWWAKSQEEWRHFEDKMCILYLHGDGGMFIQNSWLTSLTLVGSWGKKVPELRDWAVYENRPFWKLIEFGKRKLRLFACLIKGLWFKKIFFLIC